MTAVLVVAAVMEIYHWGTTFHLSLHQLPCWLKSLLHMYRVGKQIMALSILDLTSCYHRFPIGIQSSKSENGWKCVYSPPSSLDKGTAVDIEESSSMASFKSSGSRSISGDVA